MNFIGEESHLIGIGLVNKILISKQKTKNILFYACF